MIAFRLYSNINYTLQFPVATPVNKNESFLLKTNDNLALKVLILYTKWHKLIRPATSAYRKQFDVC